VENGHSLCLQDKLAFAQFLKSLCHIAKVFTFIYTDLDIKLMLMILAILLTKKSETINLNNIILYSLQVNKKWKVELLILEQEKIKELVK
jgi:hypothetical protein